MKDLIAVDLLLPTATLHFFAPRPSSSSSSRQHTTHPKRHKLRGKLRIVTSKPIKLRQVQIKFKGFTHLSWRDRYRNSFPAGSAVALGASLGLMSERMEAWKTLRKSKQILLEDATLPAGVTDLGFEISVPGHLPYSYLSEFLEVGYAIVAKMSPQGKFGKSISVERRIEIVKTLMPKDVSCGYVNGYMVPAVFMSGQRESMGIRWKFSVPRFVCLDDQKGVEFVGAFFRKQPPRASCGNGTDEGGEEELKIERILVDIVQEELYRLSSSDAPDQSTTSDITSFLFPTSNPPKRHLVTPQTHPSTNLHPPWACPIHFSFPFLPPTTNMKSSKTTRMGPLTLTMDSPFLVVSHYVRLRVDFSDPHKNPPLCLGLPVNVTRRIRREEVIEAGGTDLEGLPSYTSVVRDGERLPDYTVDCDDDENGGVWSEEEDEAVIYPTTVRRIDSTRTAVTTSSMQSEPEARSDIAPSLDNNANSETDLTLTPMLDIGAATAPSSSASASASTSASARRRRATEELINRLPSVPTPSILPSPPRPSSRRPKRDTEITVHERSMTDFFEVQRSASKRPPTSNGAREVAETNLAHSSSINYSRPILRSRSTSELRGPIGRSRSRSRSRSRGGANVSAETSLHMPSASTLFYSLTS